MFTEQEKEKILEAIREINAWICSNVSTVIYKQVEIPFGGHMLVVPVNGLGTYIAENSYTTPIYLKHDVNGEKLSSDMHLGTIATACADLIGSWQDIRPALQKAAADSIRVRNAIMNFRVKPIADELR